MSQYFYNPKTQYITNAGLVASFGRLAFYESGTQTLKAVYDQDGVTPIANPVVLDSAGRSPAIKLGEGDYKVVLESFVGYDQFAQPIYQTEWTIDPYNAASGSSGDGASTLIIPNISALRAFDQYDEFTTVYVIGYYTPGDLGQGWFNFDDTSSASDDSGSVIQPNGLVGAGRWFRSFEDDVVYPQMWGVTDQLVVVNNSSRILACFEYVENNTLQKTVVIPEGNYDLDASVSLTGSDTEVVFKRGARFTRLNPIVIDVAFDVKNVVIPIKNDGIVGTEVGLSITTSDLNDIPVSSWNPGNGAVTMIEKAVGNYNGRLIIDDNYILDDRSIDLEIENIHFIASGSIEYTATYTGSLTIRRFTFEEDLTYLFRGDIDKFLYEGVSTFRAQHFIDTPNTITSDFYLDLLQSVTRNSGRQAQLIWDFYATYTFTETFSTNDDYRVSQFIGDDSQITFDEDVDFGLVSNSPTKKIFNRNGGSPRVQQTIYPQWFGMTTDNSDSSRQRNTDAINDAIVCALISKFPKVCGNNASVNILDTIVIPTPGNDEKTIELCNLELSFDLDFTGTDIIDSAANTIIRNVKFDGGDSIGGLTAFSIDTYEMEIYDCEVGTLSDLLNVPNNGLVSHIGNSKFYGIPATIFTKDGNGLMVIDGNTFRNTQLTFNKAKNINVVNNNFISNGTISNINLVANGETDYTLSGILIEDNTFNNISEANFDVVNIDAATVAIDQHGPCSVKNNNLIGDINLKTTELIYTETCTFQGPTDPVTSYVLDYKPELILSKNTSFGGLVPRPIYFNWNVYLGYTPPAGKNSYFQITYGDANYSQQIVDYDGSYLLATTTEVQFHAVSNNFNNDVYSNTP